MQPRYGILISAVMVVVAWYFWQSAFLFPVRIFVVLLHELSHAAAAILTGGELVRIELSMQEGGAAYTRGGSRFLTLNAGYVGSLLLGCGLLLLSKSARLVGVGLSLIALLTAVVTALYLRPIIGFAFLYGIGASLALTLLALKGNPTVQGFVLRFLGLFSCLYALVDIRDDILRFDRVGGLSDATMLAELTHIPAMVWGMGWLGLSVVVLVLLRRQLLLS